MERRTIGTTDISVSKICLGTMTWGSQNTQEQAFEQMDYAISEGVNFFDTAEIYPVPMSEEKYANTETIIGNWLMKRNKEQKNRDQVVIATKVAGPKVPWIRDGEGFTPSGITDAVTHSLERLKTDYIDLYQLHWPQRNIPKWGRVNYQESMFDPQARDQILETLQALDREVKSGRIRAIGLSNESAWGTQCFLQLAEQHGLARMQTIQNAYSLIRREYENSLTEISMQEKIGLLAYSPLAGGVLTGKYRNNQIPKGSRMDLHRELMGYYMSPASHATVEELLTIAEDVNLSLTQLSLAFVNERGFVTSNIIGATTMEQLKENIHSAQVKLNEDTVDKINEVFKKYPNPATY